jgi:short-subunit dehydrogenase
MTFAPGVRWKGHTWLILGASSSVARAFARLAAEGGADLLLAGRDRADIERTAADIRLRTGRSVEVLYFDADPYTDHLGFAEACRAKVAAAEGQREGQCLDVFLAFGAGPSQGDIDRDFTLAQRAITVNYTGAVSVLARLAPILEAQRGGQVVVLTSVAGDRGRKKNYVYGSAKAGLNAYLQGLRGRLHAAGVGVTTVKAGFLDTAMTYGLPGMFLVASPGPCARACLAHAAKRREIAYFPGYWRFIMAIVKAIPERWFKRLSI